ncbi:MAG: N-6 DNA methylase, partial [Bacteroidales bacterium]|nr:N-6 DNA methylase [Bacteroidales bacterium]
NRPSGLSDTDEIRKLQEELRVCRHKIFNAKTTKTKKKWRKIDKEKRYAIAAKLKENGWDNDNADMLANWDPYDQNASSPFFDPEWMFGLQRESGNSKSGEKGGYFDIVIGNPPYGAELTDEEKSLYRKIYREIKFKINTYTLFVLNSIKLLKNEGISYFIIPNTLLDNYFEDSVREKLLTEYCILEINDLDDKVFDAAVVHSMIFAIKKKYCANYNVKVNTGSELNLDYFYIPSSFFIRQDNYAYNIRNYSSDKLITKLNDGCEKLFDVLDIRQAIKTGNDKIYLSDQKIDETYKPILRGKDIYRYGNSNPNLYVQYGKHLACPRNPSIFEQPKILIREAGSKIIATLDYNNFYIMSSLYNGISKDNDYDLSYLLGLINSKLFQYLINKLTFEKTKGAFTKAKIFHYYGLPVKVLTITQQEPIIALVNQILQIKQKNSQANTSVLEKQIDLLIYKLYDLTYEEVKIIDPDFDLTEKEYISNNYYVK